MAVGFNILTWVLIIIVKSLLSVPLMTTNLDCFIIGNIFSTTLKQSSLPSKWVHKLNFYEIYQLRLMG
jgi:hypothetical protein